MPAETAKERALEATRALPDDATIEDAIEKLCFIAKIKEGLQPSETGRVVSHEEVQKRFLV
jgi:predicted transcriptional regulator